MDGKSNRRMKAGTWSDLPRCWKNVCVLQTCTSHAAPAKLLYRHEIPNFYLSKIYWWKYGGMSGESQMNFKFPYTLPLIFHEIFWIPYKLWPSSSTYHKAFSLRCSPWLLEFILGPSTSLQYPEKSTCGYFYASMPGFNPLKGGKRTSLAK